jgi:hypothetical protein
MKPFKFLTFLIGAVLLLATSALNAVGIQTEIKMPPGQTLQVNGIANEIWVNYIIGNLFKDNSFLTKCHDESEYVLGGAVVHIPQAGAKPNVVKNRTVYPATMVRRTDTDITYAIDEYSTDPTHITDAEAKEISYDKINSVLGEHIAALTENYADDLLYKWAPTLAAQMVRTTGSASSTALAPGATGTRKKFVKADLQAARAVMNKNNIPLEERYALIPTDMYMQLIEDADLLVRDGASGGEIDLKNGIVMKLYGFNIMERSATTVYDNTGTPVPKAPGAATATTDNLSILCWQKHAVAKALGSTKFFETIGNAENYGDVYSAAVRLGGRKRRTNGEGVVAIIQAA